MYGEPYRGFESHPLRHNVRRGLVSLPVRKSRVICAVVFGLIACAAPASAQRRAKQSHWTLCPDPTAACRTSYQFQPYNLQFRVPENAVIYETELFYAVILKSVRDASKGSDCNVFVPEAERLEAQALFPHNKVFASRCAEPGTLYYTNVKPDVRFMAVYAGRTRAEADALLAQVKATGKYPDANLRRMSIGFNGT